MIVEYNDDTKNLKLFRLFFNFFIVLIKRV